MKIFSFEFKSFLVKTSEVFSTIISVLNMSYLDNRYRGIIDNKLVKYRTESETGFEVLGLLYLI